MLPSTGYFNSINCPFYDSGLCERPYCHYRHAKKDSQNIVNESAESGKVFQQIVSEAVRKVLQQKEIAGASKTISSDTITGNKDVDTLAKPTYNPTPIAELNKIIREEAENVEEIVEQRRKHIPVPYTPRKPATLPLKRPVESNGAVKPFIYIPPKATYNPGCADNVSVDPYTPKGGTTSADKYLPGSDAQLQAYTPDSKVTSKTVYVPSDKSDKNGSKKKLLEYKPTKVSKHESQSVSYQPTPLDQVPCFSSDEDEPNNKKSRLITDFNDLDDLETEFEILDQILDEEKSKESSSTKQINDNKTIICDDKDKSVSSSNVKEKDESVVHKKSSSSSKTKERQRKNSDCKNEKHKNSNKSSSSRSKSKDNSKPEKERKHRSDSDKKLSSKHSKESSSRHRNSHSKDHSHTKNKEHRNHKESKHHKSSREKSSEKQKHHKSKHREVENDRCLDDNHSDGNVELIDQISESDEETIALECKRIFEEYVPVEKPLQTQENSVIEQDQADEYIPTKKRISRTTDKDVKKISRPPLKPDFKLNAAKVMAERLAKVKEYHMQNQTKIASKDNGNSTIKPDVNKVVNSSTTNSSSTKIRIAHVPYASTLMNAKKNISLQPLVTSSEATTSSTLTQTIAKGTKRVAHMPNEKFIDRPGVLEPLASKIPSNVRSTYLNAMIDECLKIYLAPSDAYNRAQHEELNTSRKCSAIQIYKNSAALTIGRLRKETLQCNGIKKTAENCESLRKLSPALTGKCNNLSNYGTWSIENKSKNTPNSKAEFVGSKFYENVSKWILTEQQLQDNGFPRLHPSGEKGRAIIYNQTKKQTPPKGNIRICSRCNKDYMVDKKGLALIKQDCIYHPSRKFRFRGEARYQCCSQDETSDGCCMAPTHVYEYVDYDNLRGFVKTLDRPNHFNIYALDCEMCYTTHGLDLTRITIIDSACQVIYETLIKPFHPIIDYNTKYSGITEEQMSNVTTTLLDVQATMLSMFDSKTILIGHSLESDFKALKLIHDTVIDTSILFPHKMGPPYKRALRNLSSEHLKKIIQNSVDGHDSAEDATVCMELLQYKLKEDLKVR